MALAITEDHAALAEVARAFATAQDLRAETRAALDEPPTTSGPSWKRISDLGWTGLHLPEEFGGSGYGLPELAVILDELGAVAAPGPFLPSVIGSAIVNALGSDDLRGQLLPGAADGSTVIVWSAGGSLTLDGSGSVRGHVTTVLGGVWADHLVIENGADLLVVSTADSGTTSSPIDALDASAGLARFDFDGAGAEVIVGAAGAARAIARTLGAAEAAGGARATLDMALAYAKVREQFGRIIGSFQAIKHHLADMLVESERATAVAWDAARSDGGDSDQAELAGAVAGVVAYEAYQHNAQMNIQVHGGIGFTWEHDAHLYLRRAITLSALLGQPAAASADVLRLSAQGVRRQYAIDLPPEAEDYRASARAFAEQFSGVPEADRRRVFAESGYLVPHWPPPWGRGAGPVEQLVIDEELAEITSPNLGISGWVVLTISQHGSPEQVDRWVGPSLNGEFQWCQLFSEPGAGSDAAAVQTKAVRVEGGWRITGQKVWTSGAQNCNRGLATVRTDPSAAKHKGITTVVVDMQAEGVDVRPLREITGEALFNEVFFDDVFVPDADVVGEINAGWTVARATLGNERVSIGGNSRDAATAVELVELLDEYAPGDAVLGRELGGLIAAEQTMRLINLRQVARALFGSGPGAEGNVTKLLISQHAQNITELGLRIAGPAGVDGSQPALSREYLMARALTIAGGTSEVSRNVIAERLLGLPRDPLNR